jgi:hypothetical protein
MTTTQKLFCLPFAAVVTGRGIPCNTIGAHVDKTWNPLGLGGSHHMGCALTMQAIEGHSASRKFANNTDQMNHRLATLQSPRQRNRIGYVAEPHLQPLAIG